LFYTREFNTEPTEQRIARILRTGGREKGGLQTYVQWQGTSVLETQRVDKATRNAGDSVANVKNEQLLFVTTGYKLWKGCSD